MSNVFIKLQNKNRSGDTLGRIGRAHVSWLLAVGMSNKAIKKEAHVTDGQISRVVRRTGLRRSDYRDGVSPVARYVLKNLRKQALDYAEPKLLPWERSLTKEKPIKQNGLLRKAA